MSELIAMAMAYRNWSQRELAEFLGRDVHNLIPPSGIPKVDVVLRLAQALDWPSSAVLDDICGEPASPKSGGDLPSADFHALNRASAHAAHEGQFIRALELALRTAAAARTPDESCEADRRECVAWDGMGRYQRAIEAIQRGLQRTGVSQIARAELRANLASSYLALGQLDEAEGIATSQLEAVEGLAGYGPHRLAMRAHLLLVRGQCRFWRIDLEPDAAQGLATLAKGDLEQSIELWEIYSAHTLPEACRGFQRTAQGVLLALEPELESRSSIAVLDEFVESLDDAVDLAAVPKGVLLESYGWWCIFATAVAMRHQRGHDDLERYLAIFINKAYEVADLSGNWALRERAFNHDYLRGAKLPSESRNVLDVEDIRSLVGAMGRFPAFRLRGWELYRRSTRI